MSITAWIERLPVEDWAAGVGRNVRRVKRRVARRPLRTVGPLVVAVGAVVIGVNALWEQDGSHPSPLWNGEGERPMVGAHAPASPDPATASSSLVLGVQGGLKAAGLYDGPADGTLDEATRQAILAFEARRGMPETGEPSLALLAAVSDGGGVPAVDAGSVREVASSWLAERTGTVRPLERDNTVQTVPQIQAALNAVGYGPLTVDGQMGPKTRKALGAFASANGLAGQGMTPQVLRALSDARAAL